MSRKTIRGYVPQRAQVNEDGTFSANCSCALWAVPLAGPPKLILRVERYAANVAFDYKLKDGETWRIVYG